MDIGPGMSRRKEQYEHLRKDLYRVIKIYCEERLDSGWSFQAKKFLTEIELWPWPSFDEPLFLKLYTRIQEFTQTLVSQSSYIASYFVSQKTLDSYGCGSALKERLENMLSVYEPYHIQWIAAEVAVLKTQQMVAEMLHQTPTHSNYYPGLSRESKEVLRQALQDEALMSVLKKGADNSYIAQAFDKLVEAAKNTNGMGLRVAQTHKRY